MRTTRLAVALVATAAFNALLMGCSSAHDSTSATRGATNGATNGATSGVAGNAQHPAIKRPAIKSIIVSIKDGKVSPQMGHISVDKGNTVKILVNSDVPDEVEVQGYGEKSEMAPDRPALFVFSAIHTGQFDVRTHHGKQVLLTLQVK